MKTSDALKNGNSRLFPYEEMTSAGFSEKNIGKMLLLEGVEYRLMNLHYHPGINQYHIELLDSTGSSRVITWRELKELPINWTEEKK